MKKRFLILLLSLVLIFALASPALAGYDYELVYDDTEKLDEDMLTRFGTETYRELTDKYRIEIRVDIVQDLEGYTIEDYADLFYEKYEYGYEGTRDGVLLMLQLSVGQTSVELVNWCVRSGGENGYLVNAPWSIYDKLSDKMSAEAWYGSMEEDNAACEAVLTAFADAYEEYIMSGGAGEIEGVVGSTSAPQETPAVTAAPVNEPAPVISAEHVLDEAGILTDSEQQSLEALAAAYSQQYDCGFYIAAVYDYNTYSTYSVMDAAAEVFEVNDFGHGETKDGVLLLLSMAERDYALIAHGWGSEAVTEKGRGMVEDAMLPFFRENDWAGGFESYLNKEAELVSAAREGHAVDFTEEELKKIAFKEMTDKLTDSILYIIFIPLVLAFVAKFLAEMSMKSVKAGDSADEYVAPGSFNLLSSNDSYSHSDTRVVYKKTDDDDSGGSSGGGGGGFSSSRDSSYSGSSGKF